MPSVASDPSSILPPPVRGAKASPSGAKAGADASAFADHLDAPAEPPRDRAKPRDTQRSRADDRAPASRAAAKPSKTDKPKEPSKDAKADKPDDTTKAAAEAKTDETNAAADAGQATETSDQAAEEFKAAAADIVADPDAKTDDQIADGETPETKPDAVAIEAAIVPEQPVVAMPAQSVPSAEADIAVLTQVQAPKTSVPQIPRAHVNGSAAAQTADGEAIAQAADNDAITADADGTEAAKPAKPFDIESAPRPANPATVARAERFDPAQDLDLAALPKDNAAKAPDIVLPQIHSAQAQHTAQAASANAVQSAARSIPVEGLAVEIAARAAEGKHRFEIRLDPPELGKIEVRLDVDKNGHVVSHITADRGDTLDLLRRDAQNLERALQDAGLKTGQNNLQFSLRDQGAQQHAHSHDSAGLVANDDLNPLPEIPAAYRARPGSAGGVDIRV